MTPEQLFQLLVLLLVCGAALRVLLQPMVWVTLLLIIGGKISHDVGSAIALLPGMVAVAYFAFVRPVIDRIRGRHRFRLFWW